MKAKTNYVKKKIKYSNKWGIVNLQVNGNNFEGLELGVYESYNYETENIVTLAS